MIRTPQPNIPRRPTKGLHDRPHSSAPSCSPLPLALPHQRLRCIRTSPRPIHPHATHRYRHSIPARLRRHHRQRDPPPHRLFRRHPPHHHPPQRHRNESPATLAATTRTILQRRTFPIHQRRKSRHSENRQTHRLHLP